MSDAGYPPPWYRMEEKEAWWAFEKQFPEPAKAIQHLVLNIWFSEANCDDEVLTSRAQMEVLMLRVAELLGLLPKPPEKVEETATVSENVQVVAGYIPMSEGVARWLGIPPYDS